MSAFPLEADTSPFSCDVGLLPVADIATHSITSSARCKNAGGIVMPGGGEIFN
jgi:hypothetical protein